MSAAPRTSPRPPTTSRPWPRSCATASRAGALGFSTSRTIMHRAVDGEPVPGTFAAEDELFGIGAVLGELGHRPVRARARGRDGRGPRGPRAEVAWMRRLSATIGRPVSFALSQHNLAPDQWRDVLRLAQEANAEGADLRGPGGRAPAQPADRLPDLPPVPGPAHVPEDRRPPAGRAGGGAAAARGARRHPLRDLAARARSTPSSGPASTRMFPIGEPPDYEPTPDRSIAAIAARERRDPEAVLYDVMLAHDGRELVMKAAAQLQLRQPRRHARDDPAPERSPRPLRRRRALRRDLRRVDPHVHAHALGPRPRAAASASRSSSWYRSRPATPPGSTAWATVAWWRRATGPTST